MSTLSRLLRILIRINVFPFKADFQKRKLSFAFCSRPTFMYAFVVFALLSMQFLSLGEWNYHGLYVLLSSNLECSTLGV